MRVTNPQQKTDASRLILLEALNTVYSVYLSAGSTCDIFLSCSPPDSRTAPGHVAHTESVNIPMEHKQKQQYKLQQYKCQTSYNFFINPNSSMFYNSHSYFPDY